MASIPYCVDVFPTDRLRIRDLVLEDPVALEKWTLVVDRVLIPQRWQNVKLEIKALINTNIAEAVLKLLNEWQSLGSERRCLLDDLRHCGLATLAGRISKELIPKSVLAGTWSGVPQLVSNFTGRETHLEKLHSSLIRSSPPGTVNVVYLTGLGGIGKTALASQLAFRKCFEYDGNVIWVNAENTEKILNSFRNAAKIAGVKLDNQISPEDTAKAVYDHFRDRKSLFIFDNVQNKSALEPFLYKIRDVRDSIPFVLVTSRRRDWGDPGSTERHLTELLPEEANKLIQESLMGKDSSEVANADQLANNLHFLPLALQQAVVYIKEKYGAYNKNCIDKYLKKFGVKKTKLLSHEGFRSYTDYPCTPMTTWSSTLNCITHRRGEASSRLINALSFINHKGISRTFLEQIGVAEEKCLRALVNTSMISCTDEENEDAFDINRVVQLVVRLTSPSENSEEQVNCILQRAVSWLMQANYVQATKLTQECQIHLLHLFPLQTRQMEIDEAARLCDCLLAGHDHQHSLEFAMKFSDIFESVFAASHEITLRMKLKMAEVHVSNSQRLVGEKIIDVVLETCRLQHTNEHWLTQELLNKASRILHN